MATLTKYQIHDFQNISQNNIKELDDSIINIINELASKVGAPNYNKTPIFKKNKQKSKYENWSTIRNFKQTTLEKHTDGIEAQMDDIRMKLNKLTSKNYDELSIEIINYIKKDMESNDDILNHVGKSIFEVGSLNSFWSKLYAKLFNDLILNFPIMKIICINNFNDFLPLFNEIKFINIDNNNYNEFCENNKNNENRRSMSSFFINIMYYDIISLDLMYDLIKNLMDKVDYNDDAEDFNINEEIIENLFILIKGGHEKLKENEEKWNYLVDKINIYVDNKDGHISKKSIFKFLDLLEEIE